MKILQFLVFGTTTEYTRKYDLDLVREVAGDQIARRVVLLSDRAFGFENVKEVVLGCGGVLNDVYRVFPYIVYGQLFVSLDFSLRLETDRYTITYWYSKPRRSGCLLFTNSNNKEKRMKTYTEPCIWES